MTETNDERVFESLLNFLRQSRGFDFTGYKRSTLQRRVTKRMQVHGIENFSNYLDYLQVHPDEFVPLFNTILINVTSFFRDRDAWEHVRQHLLPYLLENKSAEAPIRVWSAGCSSGEETYTIAIILSELLGIEEFRQRVKIYATDVDEEALTHARHARYSAKAIEVLSEEQQEQYFENNGRENYYVFRPDLRRNIIFGRHDLVQDAPISRLDFLVCRNTLMYFNAEAQSKIIARFHFALKNTGVMFLGKAEMLMNHGNLFSPLNLQHRTFKKIPQPNLRDRLLVLSHSIDDNTEEQSSPGRRLREAAFDLTPIAQIVVDEEGNLAMINSQAQSEFNLNLQDIGRSLQDLEVSYRPLELRSLIDQVYAEGSPIVVNDVERYLRNEEPQYFDVQITPLQTDNSDWIGTSITFINITRYHQLQEELHQSQQELETTNEELQSSNEELETTNEELQSTNEELETTNEELQSTNEELETMNEELQSTNEELTTINDELQMRTNDLNEANAFLRCILASIQAGVIVVDRQFNVLSWNHEAENQWGLRANEVEGRPLFSLDMGLPVGQLGEPIRNCLDGDNSEELTLEATNRRGRTNRYHIRFSPLQGVDYLQLRGVILMIEEIEEGSSSPPLETGQP